eukprot:TRINITY_DN899_c0_g1_i1.p1 TRINITY_DN899_c0_g1~~TRINITY_DN899_c0_g1_i1.p1  ORF type:complete len:165 (+),score=39.83 TRINITY_DN899_c0_g1_i1:454-948(+)
MGAFDSLVELGEDEITRDQVHTRIKEMYGEDVADLVVDNALKVADTDGSGSVSREELLRVHLMNPMARKHMDADCNNSIERAELLALATTSVGESHSAEIVERLFNELDSDNSGSVDSCELQLWLSKNFRMETVNVPGQMLDRGEIVAVQTRIRERFGENGCDK